jgi:hypothetical protein
MTISPTRRFSRLSIRKVIPRNGTPTARSGIAVHYLDRITSSSSRDEARSVVQKSNEDAILAKRLLRAKELECAELKNTLVQQEATIKMLIDSVQGLEVIKSQWLDTRQRLDKAHDDNRELQFEVNSMLAASGRSDEISEVEATMCEADVHKDSSVYSPVKHASVPEYNQALKEVKPTTVCGIGLGFSFFTRQY